MSLTEAAFGEAIKRVSDTAWPVLVVITHPKINGPLYLTTEPGGITSNGIDYTYFPFDAVMPGDGGGMPRARVRFQNVDRTIGDAILRINDPADISFYIVTSLDHDTVEREFLNFRLVSIEGNAAEISGELIVRNFDVEPWPSTVATQALLPGLWR